MSQYFIKLKKPTLHVLFYDTTLEAYVLIHIQEKWRGCVNYDKPSITV